MAPSMSWLKADLQEHCTQAGISFRAKDTKQDLLNLIQAASGRGSNERRGSSGNSHQHGPADRRGSGGQPNMEWLKADLQAYCNRQNISYNSRHTKQQLLDLIDSQGRRSMSARPVRRSSSSSGSSQSEPRSAFNKQPSSEWLKADLQAYCQQHGISFKTRDTKQQLLDLIQGAGGSLPGRGSSDNSVSIGSAGSSSSGCACSGARAARPSKAQGRKKTSKGAESVRTDSSTATAAKVIEKSSVLVCNAVGTTCDKMPGGWRNKWSEVTGRKPGVCAAAGCGDDGSNGGHVYIKGQSKEYCYIVPICSHHNSKLYNDAGFDTEWYSTKANTAFMRIRVHQCFIEHSSTSSVTVFTDWD